MEQQLAWIMVVMAGVLAIIVWFFAKPPTPHKPDPNLQQRWQLERDYLEGAQEVMSKAHDARTKQIATLLSDNTCLVAPEPAPQDLQYLQKPPQGRKSTFLIVLLPGEENLSPTWKSRAPGPKTLGLSLPEGRIIILKQLAIRNIWKGIILFHEGDHLQNWIDQKFTQEIKDPAILKAFDEVDVRTYQHQLMCEVFPKYRTFSDSKILTLHSHLIHNNPGPALSLSRKELANVFGPAISEEEETMEESLVFEDCILQHSWEYGNPLKPSQDHWAATVFFYYNFSKGQKAL